MVLIKEAKTKDEILQAIFLRRKVLVFENNYSVFESEPDKDDLISKVYIAVSIVKNKNKNPNRPKGRGIFNVSDTPSDNGRLMQNNPATRNKAKDFISVQKYDSFRISCTASSGVSETNKNKVIGTSRVKKEGNIFRIQRMAIDQKYRKKGIGSLIIRRILKDFRNKKIYLMAPKSTIPFYLKFGFRKTSKIQKGKHHIYYRLQNF